MVPPSPRGTPATVAGVPVKVQPTPKDKVDIVISPSGETVSGNYPTFDKSTPREKETVVKAKPGAITQQGGRTAFITEAVSVGDGDTATFKDTDGKNLVCRLARIEAPETKKPSMGGKPATPGQPYGDESTQTLKDMIMGKQATVTVTQLYDNRGKRSVCEIEVNGENINQKMLEQGAAWLYKTYGKKSRAAPFTDQLTEARAKTDKKGLFNLPGYEYPGDYKRRMDALAEDN